MSTELPGPVPAPDAGPYWDAANEKRLVIQQCLDCRRHRFIPRHVCSACGSDAVEWVDASGEGIIHSLTTVHRGPTPAFRAHVPYIVALIDLAEGPRMMANIVGEGADEATIGDAVRVCFEERQGGGHVPQFECVVR